MFEDYIEDSFYFYQLVAKHKGEREKKRNYRASIFYATSAIEAFVNFVGDTLKQGSALPPYEIAFLTDKKFGFDNGHFKISDRASYNRLEDKLRFILCKYNAAFDFKNNSHWSQLIEFKKFRDSLIHPKQDEDDIKISEYEKKVKAGIASVIIIIDIICRSVFKKPLRKKLMDLVP